MKRDEVLLVPRDELVDARLWMRNTLLRLIPKSLGLFLIGTYKCDA